MKIIITAIAIALATITTANADNIKDGYIFKAEQLEIQSALFEQDAATYKSKAITYLATIEKLKEEGLAINTRSVIAIEAVMESYVTPNLAQAEHLEAEAARMREQAAMYRRKAEGN